MRKVSDLVRTVSDFPWAPAPKLAPDEPLEPGTPRPQAERPAPQPERPTPAKAGKTTFADIGARIGADNEVLRNLLIETGHQLAAIDDLKAGFGRLTEPLANLLTTLENERSEHARSKGELAALRTGHDTLRGDFQKLEARSTELKADNERLNRGLAQALQKTRELEDNRSELRSELAATKATLATTAKQFEDEAARVRSLSDEKTLLTERTEAADKKISGLESELAQARERISLLENGKTSLQAALDKTLGESSRVSRQLGETESALTQARNRIQQVEGNLATAEAERDKLVAALDEANERRQSEVYALELKLDAMRSRSEAAEQMLATARQNLIGRSEALRGSEARHFEANAARTEAEKKAEHLMAIAEERRQQIELLEHETTQLSERCRALLESQTANESALAGAQEHIASLSAHVEQLRFETDGYRTKTEEDIVQLNAALEHERCERLLAEAALDTARQDVARLQQQSAHHQRHFAKS